VTAGAGVDLDAWHDHLVEPFRGRPVVIAFKMLAAMTAQVEQLKRWGAKPPLLVARGVGAGPLPGDTDAETLLLDVDPVDTGSEEIRLMTGLAAELPPEVVRRVAEYDPAGEAVWWIPPFTEQTELLGRPVFGGRRPAWAALEDKTRCDEIWDAAEIPSVPTRVVPASHDDLVAASERLRSPDGVVWSGDATAGVNGDGDYVRRIRSDRDARTAADYFASRCTHVRVMPFLEGVPCSIHGIVLDDGVAVFRPVELVTLRRPDTAAFVFAGMSTWWDPSNADRRAMREAARRVGKLLAERVGYRGGFNIDGVLTRDGFRPTELNPRFSTAMATVLAHQPLELVHLNAVAGRGAGIAVAELERLAVDAADQHRRGYAMCAGAQEDPPVDRAEVVQVDGGFDEAPDGSEPAGLLMIRPAVTRRALVRFVPAPGLLRPGMRLADLTVQALDFAEQRWGCDFGRLQSAPDVRGPAAPEGPVGD
jgi:hypothetical protein